MTRSIIPFEAWTVHGRWGRTNRFRAKPPKALVVHHAVATSHQTRPGIEQAQHIEEIQFHRKSRTGNKIFGMVAYNYLVASDGKIFEGRGARYGNGANAPAKHGKALGLSNRNTVSVCLYGSFHRPIRPGEDLDAQLRAVVWLAQHLGVGRIVGHRDVSATSCPGGRAYTAIQLLGSPGSGRPPEPVPPLKPLPEPDHPSSATSLPAKIVGLNRGNIMVLQKIVGGLTVDGIMGRKTYEATCRKLQGRS